MFEGKKILWVAGGRDYNDPDEMRTKLTSLATRGYEVLVEGAAPGADLVAEHMWRTKLQLPYVGVPARWNHYGNSAGAIRNRIIAHMRPTALLALPGGRGTQDARDAAREYGVDILDEL